MAIQRLKTPSSAKVQKFNVSLDPAKSLLPTGRAEGTSVRMYP